MAFETLSVDREGPIAVLRLSRPDRANAISTRMLVELVKAQTMIAADEAVTAVIVTGEGRHFCGGADLHDEDALPVGVRIGFERIPQPVIAAINGAAVGGGCEIALACDYRIAGESSYLALPEIQFGELPAGGATARLPRLVGTAVAKRLVWTGERIEARTALQLGLVEEVCDDADLLDRATRLAMRISDHPPYAVRAAKLLLDRAPDLDIESALAFERQVTATMATAEERLSARKRAAAVNPVYARIFGES